MKRLITAALTLLIASCTSNSARIDEFAQAAKLQRAELEVDELRSIVYTRASSTASRLVVFLEGDGQPWVGGVVPAEDPTTRDPLALKLLIRTPGATAYIGRPCYQNARSARCTAELWTQARYSMPVVEAMRATIKQTADTLRASEIVLVGYSGGGVLAVLIAERLEKVVGVITVAANLDIDAWTTHHRYLPLTQSLNPARSEQAHDWPEVHLMGRRDEVVPSALSAAYFERFPRAQLWTFDQHGHVCCWMDEWDSLWPRIVRALER